MGKNLKGKEIGKGLSQEKNGLYLARYVDKFGKRQTKRFKNLQECKQWYADATYEDEHTDLTRPSELTVDAWFENWYKTKESTTKPNTHSSYKTRYKKDIQEVIGYMQLTEVKPMHCQLIFNKMAEKNRSNNTMNSTRIVLHNLFELAQANDIIHQNPCHKLVKSNIGIEKEEKEALTKEEHQRFLEIIRGCKYENQYRFVLQTGLRAAELVGLKWSDIDFKGRKIKVTQITYFHNESTISGTPKSKSSIRVIPLTDEAIRLLKLEKEKMSSLKVIPIEWKDYVFLNPRNGEPILTSRYDETIYRLCDKNHFKRISMHILRHTFATRCIEGGMKPKTLQKIMGHSSITVTMNRYVHTTEEEKHREISLVSDALLGMVQ